MADESRTWYMGQSGTPFGDTPPTQPTPSRPAAPRRDRPRAGRDRRPASRPASRPQYPTTAFGLTDPVRLHPQAQTDAIYLARRHARTLAHAPGGAEYVFAAWATATGPREAWAATLDPILTRRHYMPQELVLVVVGLSGAESPPANRSGACPEVVAAAYPVQHLGGLHVLAGGGAAVTRSVTDFPAAGDGGMSAFAPDTEGVFACAARWALAQLTARAVDPPSAAPTFPRLAALREGDSPTVVPVSAAAPGDAIVLDFGSTISGRSLEPAGLVDGLAPWVVMPGFVGAFGARLGEVTVAAVM